MNVFSKYTIETLKKNRTRTIVTIICIILSVAMFTAVTESIVSGQQYLINSVKATVGSFHAQFLDISSEQVEKLSKDDDFKEVETLQNIGYAEIGSNNEWKPYLFIGGMSKNFTDMVAVNLIEGRMPEKSGEIVLPRHLYTNGRVDYKVGDVLNLTVGERQNGNGITWGDQDFEPDTEKLVGTKQRTYTVVGICKRPDISVERHENPAYMAYTLKEDDSSLSYKAYFTLANPKNLLDSTYTKDEEYGGFRNENLDLLTFSGMNTGHSIMPVVYALGAILIAIIMLGSVALIYNSFSISVSERTKQFGLLRSVGATKKQMIRTVLCEALFLCGVAVPIGLLSGCLGIGVTFRLLSGQFAMILSDEVKTTGGAVIMKLVPNVYALLVAALISVFTALISAYIPVKRAMKMSAIEAIRMSNDIKVKGKKLKTGKLSGKLFGFEGMLAQKNFKRNKKKYRTTVISLAMSLILFISASSLCFYFQKTVNMDMNAIGYDVSAMTNPTVLSNKEARAVIDEIGKTDGIDESSVVAEWDIDFIAKVSDVNKDIVDNYFSVNGGYVNNVCTRYFVNDEAFNKLCKENGLAEKDYYNKSEPMALLYDKRNFQSYDEKTKTSTYYQESVFNVKKFPATINAVELEETKNGGVCNGLADNGKVFYGTGEKDYYYDIEECISQKGVRVGAKLQDAPFFLMNSSTVIMYPESMMEAVCGETPQRIYYHGYYKAENYNAVYENMLKIADSSSDGIEVSNESEGKDTIKALLTLIKVFSYGFITLISLIAAANVFNTISTNIMLRRRELAMLKSVGMSDKGFRKMMSYESLLYGIKSILLGLPLSLVITYLIYFVVSDSGYDMVFTLPFGNIIFALVSVILVVFASMIYSVKKLKKYNTADELKNENL